MPRVQLAGRAGTVSIDPAQANYETANVAIITTTEKVLITLTLSGLPAGTPILLLGLAAVTLGTGTTSLASRVRRGTTIAGTQIGEANTIEGTAANTVHGLIMLADITTQDGESYVLTAQQNGATANGTSLQQVLAAIPLIR